MYNLPAIKLLTGQEVYRLFLDPPVHSSRYLAAVSVIKDNSILIQRLFFCC